MRSGSGAASRRRKCSKTSCLDVTIESGKVQRFPIKLRPACGGQAATLCCVKTVVYKTVQGHDIHADIYAADSDGPAILFVHAGGQISGNRKLISTSQVETYNRLGYSVVSIDYRLAPQTKLASVVTDVEDAYAWMRGEGSAQFGFDPDKIVVMGGSAGGYHTLLAGSRLQPNPRAVVAFYGYCDLTSPWTSTPTPFEGVPPVSEDVARAGIGDDVVSEGSIEFDSPGGDFFFFVRQ